MNGHDRTTLFKKENWNTVSSPHPYGYPGFLRPHTVRFWNERPTLTSSFDKKGKQPKTVIVVTIDEMYFQCAKALMRSKLWLSPDESDAVPTAGEFIRERQGIVAKRDPAQRDVQPFRHGGSEDAEHEGQHQVPERFRQVAILVVVVPAPEKDGNGYRHDHEQCLHHRLHQRR